MFVDLTRKTSPALAAPVNPLRSFPRGAAGCAGSERPAPAEKARMRTNQPWRWIHQAGVADFDRMTDMAKELRAALAEQHRRRGPRSSSARCPADGTRSGLHPHGLGHRDRDRLHSSASAAPAPCASPARSAARLNCTFCHTGTQALVRNLTAAEIVAQVQVARDDLGGMALAQGGPPALQHRLHGHGRAALQSGQRRRRHRHHRRRRGHRHLAPADHRLDLGRRAGADGPGRAHPGHAGHLAARHQRRAARRAGAAQQEVPTSQS